MTTASYEDEGVAERRAQKAPRRWVASSERESHPARHLRGEDNLREREPGGRFARGELGPPSPTGARAARLLLS
jgi:hypothetical protein